MHILLLFLWVAIALLLRFTNLATKPVWADEFSTLVFSVGNRYSTLPLDQVLSLDQLLQPLQPNPEATPLLVMHNLLTESNHPPLSFVLTHFWLQLFPPVNGWVSVWAARSLSALWGVAAVPAMFGWGWFTFRSRLVGHLAAVLMALSPFGIYLAQEARHYTLAVLWVLASLTCLVAVVQRLQARQKLPLWLCGLWILVNGLGIATHYFVLLALTAIAISGVVWLIWDQWAEIIAGHGSFPPQTSRLGLVAIGTIASAAVWFPALRNIRGTELTRWIQRGEMDHSTWIDQLLRSLAGLISMLYLLPIQGIPAWALVSFGAIAALLLLWTVPLLWRGGRNQSRQPETAAMLVLLSSFVIAVMALSWLLTFSLGLNFSSVFRYQFICLPAVILVIAACLADYWQRQAPIIPGLKTWQIRGKAAIAIVVLFSFIGSLTVVLDFGYQRTHRPDQVAAAIHTSFQAPTLITIPYRTHAHSSRLMGIAWELHRRDPVAAQNSQFLLATAPPDQPQRPINSLKTALQSFPVPFSVWRINFRSELNPRSHAALGSQGCQVAAPLQSVDGYRYQRYDCPKSR
jgi:uncharacterized membrane protein